MIVPAGARWSSVVLSSAGNHDINKSLSKVLLLIVAVFIFLHMAQWAAKCGPFASGAYRDYCSDIDKRRQARQVVINEATQARQLAIARTPYVDLRDPPERLQQFVPPGHGMVINSANVREGPGMLYAVIANLPKDTLLEIIQEQDGWLQVRINNTGDAEEFGWVWQDLLAR